MVKNDRRLRHLVAGDTTWHWTVRQQLRPDYAECRLTLSLYPEGTRRRLTLTFRPSQHRIISNCYFESGTLVRLPDHTHLNLYEPRTVRRLLDTTQPVLNLRASEPVIELDGWPYFDTVVDTDTTARNP